MQPSQSVCSTAALVQAVNLGKQWPAFWGLLMVTRKLSMLKDIVDNKKDEYLSCDMEEWSSCKSSTRWRWRLKRSWPRGTRWRKKPGFLKIVFVKDAFNMSVMRLFHIFRWSLSKSMSTVVNTRAREKQGKIGKERSKRSPRDFSPDDEPNSAGWAGETQYRWD